MNSELKPKIRFKGFTDDWEQRKLGEIIIDTIDNRGKNPPYYCKSGIPIIDNFMIKNNGYPNLKIATRYLDDYLFNNFVRKYNELDDTLITLVGNGIGNIALFPKEKSAIIQNTLGMRFEEPKKFKYYSLLSKNNQIIKLDRGMAQPSIRQDELKDIYIELPIFDEQLKISRLMSNIDNLITLHQRKCDKLVELKKSLLEKMFPQNNSVIPEIRFKGFTDDWEQRKFDTLAKVDRGLTYSPNNLANNGIRVLRSSNINDDQFKLYDEDVFVTPNSINIEYANNNDILITSANGSSRLVGKHTIIKGISSGSTVHGGFMLLARPYINSHFLNASMSSSWYKKFIDLYVAGGNGAIGNLSKIDLDNQIVNIPNESEINKIGDLFKNLDNLITLHQRKHDKLNKIKQSLLNDMFV